MVVFVLNAAISSGFKKNVGYKNLFTSSSLSKFTLLQMAACLLASAEARAAKERQLSLLTSMLAAINLEVISKGT